MSNTSPTENENLHPTHDLNETDPANVDVDLDDVKARLVNHSENEKKGAPNDAVVLQIVDPGKEVLSDDRDSSERSFVGLGKEELAQFANDPFYVRLRLILFILFWVAWVAMLVAAIVIIILAPKCPHRPDLKWFHKNAAYKVYTKSFKDSDGDGIGDIKGVASKLGYIRKLGARTLWLSGVYQSDATDIRGVINHTEISPLVGTVEDIQAIVKEADKLDIKIMLDLFPSYTSKNHSWFQASATRDAMFADYYIWRENGTGSIPSGGFSGKGTWVYDGTRKQEYYSRVADYLPELNLANPKVLQEFEAVIAKWLALGVGGFYIDDADFLDKNANLSKEGGPDQSVDHSSHDHSQPNSEEQNQAVKLSVLQQLRSFISAKFDKPGRERFLMVSATVDNVTAADVYFGNDAGRGADLVANKNFTKNLSKSCDAMCWKHIIDGIPPAKESKWPAWVVSDEENGRLLKRVGDENTIAIFTIQMTLPGTPVIYYGDEIGMNNGEAGPELQQRDIYHTPMQWSSKDGAGFSDAAKLWIPVNNDFRLINVETEDAHRSGHGKLETIMALTQLRTNESLQFGSVVVKADGDLLWIVRQAEGFPGYLIIINFGESRISYNFYGQGGVPADVIQLVFHSIHASDVADSPKYNIKERALMVEAKETAVYKFVM